jgi:hypothetical protein
MLILLNERSIGLEGRCYRQLKQYIYLNKLYSGTWCELFKTQKYKKTMIHRHKMLSRYHRTMKRVLSTKGLTFYYYSPANQLLCNDYGLAYLIEVTIKPNEN